MEPNRFDDVEIRIVEEPAPPRRPRRAGPAVLALTAALALTGSLAAGASALTSAAEAPTRAAERSDGWDGNCRKGRDLPSSSTAFRY